MKKEKTTGEKEVVRKSEKRLGSVDQVKKGLSPEEKGKNH